MFVTVPRHPSPPVTYGLLLEVLPVANDDGGWPVYGDPAEFPHFLCDTCLGSNTWTEPVPVAGRDGVLGYVAGRRGCLDCWDRLLLEP
jgi:hypothetical protein